MNNSTVFLISFCIFNYASWITKHSHIGTHNCISVLILPLRGEKINIKLKKFKNLENLTKIISIFY